MVGGTGNDGKKQYSDHLHVSYVHYKWNDKIIFEKNANVLSKGKHYNDAVKFRSDPFIHSNKY